MFYGFFTSENSFLKNESYQNHTLLDTYNNVGMVNIWSNLYDSKSFVSNNCTDNNLDTACSTPPGMAYPFVLFQYNQNVTFYDIKVTLR
jgi:hypothetical protein